MLVGESAPKQIKLVDFGLAVICSTPKQFGIAGSAHYLAPEVINDKAYDSKIDIWSAGVGLYILIGGIMPFFASEKDELYAMIKTADFDFPSPEFDGVSKPAKALIRKILE